MEINKVYKNVLRPWTGNRDSMQYKNYANKLGIIRAISEICKKPHNKISETKKLVSTTANFWKLQSKWSMGKKPKNVIIYLTKVFIEKVNKSFYANLPHDEVK